MECTHCKSEFVVKNGKSRHGHQRWVCRDCGKMCGEIHNRRVPEAKRQSALNHYLEGVGLRATERLVGVSHNSIMKWVHQEVANIVTTPVDAGDVEYIEADELWTYVGKKKIKNGSGGLLIVLPRRSVGGVNGQL
jgi:hypothetical protein